MPVPTGGRGTKWVGTVAGNFKLVRKSTGKQIAGYGGGYRQQEREAAALRKNKPKIAARKAAAQKGVDTRYERKIVAKEQALIAKARADMKVKATVARTVAERDRLWAQGKPYVWKGVTWRKSPGGGAYFSSKQSPSLFTTGTNGISSGVKSRARAQSRNRRQKAILRRNVRKRAA